MRHIELVGPCHISVVDTDEQTGIEFRRSVLPGFFVDGVWTATDLSGEDQALLALAAEFWTAESVQAFIEANRPPPPAPPRPHKIYQQTMWGRTTGAEAVALKLALDQAETKFQMLFSSSDFFLSDHPMFAVLHWTIAESLATEAGPNFVRADQLLEMASAEEAATLPADQSV
jgi:hypothetical protein